MARRKDSPPVRRTAGVAGVPLPAILLSLTVAAVLVAVAPRAEAAFDAPKRLVAAAGLAVTAAAWFLRGGRIGPLAAAFRSPAGAFLAAGAVASVLSAALSPRPAVAWDALRWGALLALALLVGASAELGGRRSVLPGAALVAGAAVNAGVSLLSQAGWTPFRLVAQRYAEGLTGGAFLGNEGLLGLLLALAAPVALAFALSAPTRRLRIASGAALGLFLATLLSIRSLTGLSAFAAGLFAVAVSAPRLRRAALLAIPAFLLLSASLPSVRGRLVAIAGALRSGEPASLATYRAGPWAAAIEMARARPLVGYGPGTFGAEFYPHRVAAEVRLGVRLTTPVPSSTYGEAHSDLLQAAAELGVPAAIAFLAGGLLVAGRLARRAPADPEAAALLGLLLAGGVAALFWFPLHRPELALPILAALGRGLALDTGTERA